MNFHTNLTESSRVRCLVYQIQSIYIFQYLKSYTINGNYSQCVVPSGHKWKYYLMWPQAML